MTKGTDIDGGGLGPDLQKLGRDLGEESRHPISGVWIWAGDRPSAGSPKIWEIGCRQASASACQASAKPVKIWPEPTGIRIFSFRQIEDVESAAPALGVPNGVDEEGREEAPKLVRTQNKYDKAFEEECEQLFAVPPVTMPAPTMAQSGVAAEVMMPQGGVADEVTMPAAMPTPTMAQSGVAAEVMMPQGGVADEVTMPAAMPTPTLAQSGVADDVMMPQGGVADEVTMPAAPGIATESGSEYDDVVIEEEIEEESPDHDSVVVDEDYGHKNQSGHTWCGDDPGGFVRCPTGCPLPLRIRNPIVSNRSLPCGHLRKVWTPHPLIRKRTSSSLFVFRIRCPRTFLHGAGVTRHMSVTSGS